MRESHALAKPTSRLALQRLLLPLYVAREQVGAFRASALRPSPLLRPIRTFRRSSTFSKHSSVGRVLSSRSSSPGHQATLFCRGYSASFSSKSVAVTVPSFKEAPTRKRSSKWAPICLAFSVPPISGSRRGWVVGFSNLCSDDPRGAAGGLVCWLVRCLP